MLCGHSLGAGVAGILGMVRTSLSKLLLVETDDILMQMWADPETCLTVRSSGLPLGRKVSAYCFAPPYVIFSSMFVHLVWGDCGEDPVLRRSGDKVVSLFMDNPPPGRISCSSSDANFLLAQVPYGCELESTCEQDHRILRVFS